MHVAGQTRLVCSGLFLRQEGCNHLHATFCRGENGSYPGQRCARIAAVPRHAHFWDIATPERTRSCASFSSAMCVAMQSSVSFILRCIAVDKASVPRFSDRGGARALCDLTLCNFHRVRAATVPRNSLARAPTRRTAAPFHHRQRGCFLAQCFRLHRLKILNASFADLYTARSAFLKNHCSMVCSSHEMGTTSFVYFTAVVLLLSLRKVLIKELFVIFVVTFVNVLI